MNSILFTFGLIGFVITRTIGIQISDIKSIYGINTVSSCTKGQYIINTWTVCRRNSTCKNFFVYFNAWRRRYNGYYTIIFHYYFCTFLVIGLTRNKSRRKGKHHHDLFHFPNGFKLSIMYITIRSNKMFIVSLSVDNIKFYLSSYKDFLWLILGIIY